VIMGAGIYVPESRMSVRGRCEVSITAFLNPVVV